MATEGKVKVWVKSVPDGDLIEVPGLGGIPNNGEKAVDIVQVTAYEAMGYTFPANGYLELIVPPDEPDNLGTPAVISPPVVDLTPGPDLTVVSDLVPDGGN